MTFFIPVMTMLNFQQQLIQLSVSQSKIIHMLCCVIFLWKHFFHDEWHFTSVQERSGDRICVYFDS